MQTGLLTEVASRRAMAVARALVVTAAFAVPAIADSGPKYWRVQNVPANDVLNIRSGPSASKTVVGALANGDVVGNLGCRAAGGSTWCNIRLLDDMGGQGWVNAHYLKASSGPPGSSAGANINHGGRLQDRCARATAKQVGVSPGDVVVIRSTISEGNGHHMIYVGVPRATADWICEADRNGKILNVFFGGEG